MKAKKQVQFYRIYEYYNGTLKRIIGNPAPYPVHVKHKQQLVLNNPTHDYFIQRPS